MGIDLRPLLPHLPAWLMVLFRLTGIFVMAPVLGSQTVPRQVKVLLVLGLSVCVYPLLLAPGTPAASLMAEFHAQPLSLWTLVPRVAVELLLGYVIGYAASLPLVGMQMGGFVIDQQLGLGIAGSFNPELGEQAGLTGDLLFMGALAVFVGLGGHHVMLMTVVGSFQHVPLGGFTGFSALLELVLGLLAVMFELALRVAAPLLCLVFLETVVMGLIARTIPQMNILSVGFALRIIAGLGFMTASIGIAMTVYEQTLRLVLRRLLDFFAM